MSQRGMFLLRCLSRVVGAILLAVGAFSLWSVAVLAQTDIPTEPQTIPPAIFSWNLIISVVLPPIITAILMRPEASRAAKTGVMVFFSLISVFGGMYLRGELRVESFDQAVAVFLFAITLAAAFYQGIQKPGLGITPGTVGVGAR
jgi:hypothetical protein